MMMIVSYVDDDNDGEFDTLDHCQVILMVDLLALLFVSNYGIHTTAKISDCSLVGITAG